MITTRRKIQSIHSFGQPHWVGNGFRVVTLFPSESMDAARMSPFILLDYHAPYSYAPNSGRPRGVGPHPHRGFETVTVAFEGSVAHHDSAGNAGVIGPGDVQWMTAASGVLHQEYHEKNFSRQGGVMHMLQLWVNLPRAHKMDAPGYQEITASTIGRHELPEKAGEVRVIAGEYRGTRGPARTHSPINMYDVRLNAGGLMEMSFPGQHNTALLVMKGDVSINGAPVSAERFVLFGHDAEGIALQARDDAHLVLLDGEPIAGPVVQYGPFVMSTEDEIRQAFADLSQGRFGHLEES